MIHITVNKHNLTAVSDEALVSKTVGIVTFEAEFSPDWDGFEKTIVFSGKGGTVPVLYLGGEMEVPWEPLDVPGWLHISAVGLADGKRGVTAVSDPLQLYSNGELGYEIPEGEPTPGPTEQALLACARFAMEAKRAAEKAEAASVNPPKISDNRTWLIWDPEAEEYVDSGISCGSDAQAGGHYTPQVTQLDKNTMRVSFVPSREDMPAVEDVEIELPAGPAGKDGNDGAPGSPGRDGKDGSPGPAGKTPVRGEDYWTAEDKQEIVQEVMDGIEIPEGGTKFVKFVTVSEDVESYLFDDIKASEYDMFMLHMDMPVYSKEIRMRLYRRDVAVATHSNVQAVIFSMGKGKANDLSLLPCFSIRMQGSNIQALLPSFAPVSYGGKDNVELIGPIAAGTKIKLMGWKL